MVQKIKVAVLGLMLASASVAPAFAADLLVKMNAGTNSVEITNTLSTNVYVLYLKAGETRVPIHSLIQAGQKAVITVKQMELPVKIEEAACTFRGNPPAGIKRAADGKFHLSVDPA